MATTPIIQTNGSSSGLGTAGIARKDLVLGETVSLSDTEASNSGENYSWVFEDIPGGSTSVLVNPLTATPEFVPDVEGSYRLKCTVNGSFDSTLIGAVELEKTGVRVPSFEEKLHYNGGANTKGWHLALETALRNYDNLIIDRETIHLAGVQSYDSDTPFVVGQFRFDPTVYGKSAKLALTLKAVGSNGDSPLTSNVKLVDVSNTEDIVTLQFSSTTITEQSAGLTIGNAAGEIKEALTVYEVHIWVTAPGAATDTIELGSVQLDVRTLV